MRVKRRCADCPASLLTSSPSGAHPSPPRCYFQVEELKNVTQDELCDFYDKSFMSEEKRVLRACVVKNKDSEAQGYDESKEYDLGEDVGDIDAFKATLEVVE